MRFLPAGDTAVVVEFGEQVDRRVSDEVLRLAEEVRAAPPAGVVEVVPTFRSLLVQYDPLATSGGAVIASIRRLTQQPTKEHRRRRRWTIPACYAPEFALDLAVIAERTGLRADDVIAGHVQTEFHVYMIGFVPGHPYLGDLPRALDLPRRSDPRVRVPRGSIAIASALSVIYPADSPSGWHVLGATPITLFDPRWERPSLLAPGDAVRFAPIGLDEFTVMRSAVEAGRFTPTSEEIES
jgi:KipI family sensor histidine kinase inhibitor